MSIIKVLSLEGNSQLLDGGAMFGNAPRVMWEKWTPPDKLGRIPLACRSLLAQINGKNILCEVGIGNFFEPKLADRFGVQSPDKHILSYSLSNEGISEDDIDFIILSHLHFDHAGGLLPSYQSLQNDDQSLRFKNAKIVVGEKALNRALNPHLRDRVSFLPELNKRLQESGRLLIVKKGESQHTELPSEISFIYNDGHTPGQMLTQVTSANEKIIFCGDLIPGTHWVHLPITMGYDRFPEKIIDEKIKFYNDIDLKSTYIFYTHDSEFSCSKIDKNENGKFHPTLNIKKLNYEMK